LGDFGGAVSQDSDFAKNGVMIGAGYTRSPEATFQLHWKTSTDIWSFGVVLLDLIFGGGYHILNPTIDKVAPGDNAYELTVLRRMYKFFGPFPQSYETFNKEGLITIIQWIHAHGPPEKPFHRVGPKEVPPADLAFILKIMKLDPRERPTAEELLADEWFTEESEDTRAPLPEESEDTGAPLPDEQKTDGSKETED
ncbi:serine threonine protein kinase, partial [Rhypophila sp. PSN 637]